jgi:hypothetical protein
MYKELDPMLLSQLRLAIMSYLMGLEGLGFGDLGGWGLPPAIKF